MTAAVEWRPDALVSDIAMPGRDGCALLVELNQALGLRAPRAAIAVTAFAADRDRQLTAAAGYDRHISKPFNPVARARGRGAASAAAAVLTPKKPKSQLPTDSQFPISTPKFFVGSWVLGVGWDLGFGVGSWAERRPSPAPCVVVGSMKASNAPMTIARLMKRAAKASLSPPMTTAMARSRTARAASRRQNPADTT